MTHNRWLPVVGGLLMNLALGSLYAWSVFVPPLEQEFHWTRSQTSWVYTVAVVSFALTFISAGRLQDRKGPRICAFTGGILVSLGFFLASMTSSLLTLYIFFGLIVGVGNGFGYATPTPVASKWFPDKRGLVVGMMVGGYGAGQALFGTLAGARDLDVLAGQIDRVDRVMSLYKPDSDLSRLNREGYPGRVQLDRELIDLLERAGPYGQGNPQPRFAFPAHRVKFAKVVGEAHIRLQPDQFGQLSVSLRVESGQVVARLEADAPAVREWLQANHATLRSALILLATLSGAPCEQVK